MSLSSSWVEKKSYWINSASQRSFEWTEIRKGRVTGSRVGACTGESIFSTPEEEAEIIADKKEKIFTEDQIKNMEWGIKYEPDARKWYSKQYNIEVEEVGFCIPKWDTSLGYSPDFITKDGMGEIKCPQKMYRPLKRRLKEERKEERKDNYSHIWKTHYQQMMLGMVILEKNYCDYLVYCEPDKEIYLERIPFDKNYWEKEMYPKIKKFQEKLLFPLLKESIYPIQPHI